MKLHFRKFGPPQTHHAPIIVLHGLFGSLNNWATVCTKLAENYLVYALDMRNHGQSPHADSMTFADMASDVLEFMREHKIETANIIGHSMGGKIAMQLAFEHPELIEKLIVVDIAPKQYPPRHQEIFTAIDMLNAEKLTSRKHADEIIKPIITDQSVRLFLLTNMMRTDDGTYNWRINMDGIRQCYSSVSAAPQAPRSKVNQFSNPTLFIRGILSNYIQDEDLPSIKKQFPNSQIANIDKAGHWVHAEQTEAFLTALIRFLSHA